MKPQTATPIAVIGIGCWYAGARNPRQLWEGVLARRREFRRLPDQRLPVAEYYDPDPDVPDRTYCKRAGVIDGFVFDWASKRIPKATFEATDVAQWLALEVSLRAIADAGYDVNSLPVETTGVVLGNTLTGEQSRASHMRVRWPYVRRSIRTAARVRGLDPAIVEDLIVATEQYYKSVFPAYSEDLVAGMLANTIAGRVANALDLHGGGFTVDGACASSLLAITNAAEALSSGTLDLALAGGVDIALDSFEMIGFSKVGALSSGEITPFDRRASGFVPGEGCGIVVLKRLDDARRDGDQVYAVLRGWGVSSDGRGGITAPNRHGQARAIARAHARVGGAFPVDFVECHGTGTRVGDRTELAALADAIGGAATARSVGVTSIKSVIGHTKAAAGIAGFIKATLAVNRRVLPPTAGCTAPNTIFDTDAKAFYPILQGEVRAETQTLHAAVSAFGFGGINTHVLLESADLPVAAVAPDLDERALMASHQGTELFVLSGATVDAVRERLDVLRGDSAGISTAELVDLSRELTHRLDGGPVRVAFLASSPEDLLERIELTEAMVAGSSASRSMAAHASEPVWLGRVSGEPRIGFAFPGQGSQRVNAGRILVERFGWARQLVEDADQCFRSAGATGVPEALWRSADRATDRAEAAAWSDELASTQLAQPAITLASVLWAQWLRRLNIRPSVVVGHSLGELAALHIAGALSVNQLFVGVAARGRAMASGSGEAGAMASVGCDPARAEDLLARCAGYAVVANLNSPSQVVISGVRPVVEEAVRLATAAGISARLLPVSNAFHSALVGTAGETFGGAVEWPRSLAGLAVPVISTVRGAQVGAGCDLRSHLVRQITAPVDFVAATRHLQDMCDLVIEVGPGRVLTNLIADTTAHRLQAYPMESTAGADHDWNTAVAQAFVHGVDVNWDALFEGRLVRPFVQASQKVFIDNYCERPFRVNGDALATVPRPAAGSTLPAVPGLSTTALDEYLSRRGRFLADVIRADLGTVDKMHTPQSIRPAAGTAAPPATASVEAPAPARGEVPTASVTPSVVASVESAMARLMALVAELTDQSRLLDDLNLDSIKAGELISKLAREFGASSRVDAAALANATIAEIATLVEQVGMPPVSGPPSHAQPPITAAVPATADPSLGSDLQPRQKTEDVVIELVASRTGYPTDSILPTMRLLDDLHLDSIKSGEIIAAAARVVGVPGATDAAALANASIQQIADELYAALPDQSGQLSATAATPNATPGTAAENQISRAAAADLVIAAIAQRTGYPPSSILLESRLRDDLNLDSIKAGEIISQVGRAISGANLDPAALANATIAEIAEQLRQHEPERPIAVVAADAVPRRTPAAAAVPAGPAATAADFDASRYPAWLRHFVVDYVETAPAAPTTDWTTAEVLLVAEGHEGQNLAAAMSAELSARGARVRVTDFAGKHQALHSNSHVSHLVAVLPARPDPTATPAQRLGRVISRLRSVALAPIVPTAQGQPTTVAYVQFGGGRFGHTGPTMSYEQGSAHAFAASLQQERPDLRVRVLDCSLGSQMASLAACLADELGSADAFAAVGFDVDLVRRVALPRPLGQGDWIRRSVRWSADDVLLVTGGGKGITAELALGTAKGLRLRTALVGSTPYQPGDAPTPATEEIVRTLQRFAADGLAARYFTCDLADAAAVHATVRQIAAEYGPITAVIHGAAVNHPRPLREVDDADALNEVTPKVLGALHLCQALQDMPPKLFVGLSSVLELIGIAGNAWYAFSNEALSLIVRDFVANHPQTAGLTVPFTVWSDVGMGKRMGSVGHLAKLGISAINTADAVNLFRRVFIRDPGASRVAVASRVSRPTWSPPTPPPTQWRFLERILFEQPGVELIARAHLDFDRDRYLGDHIFRGSALFPTVFGLEAMAQAVARVTGQTQLGPLVIEGVRLDRPIVAEPRTGVEIEIRAEVRENTGGPTEVAVVIGSEQTDFTVPHFSATFILQEPDAPPAAPVSLDRPALALDPHTDLYGGLLFVGPLFQRIESIHGLDRAGDATGSCLFRARCEPATHSVPGLPGQVVLGDTYFRDSLLHSFQIVAGTRTCLPVAIERVELYTAGGAARWGHTDVKRFVDGRARADLYALSEDGQVLERLLGTGFRQVADAGPTDEQPPSQLIRSLLADQAYRLKAQLPGYTIARLPGLSIDPKETRHDRELEHINNALSQWKKENKS